MWECLVSFFGPRCAPPAALRRGVKMTCLAASKDGVTCHYDNDWGFKICYDNNGCLLGAHDNDMVSSPLAAEG